MTDKQINSVGTHTRTMRKASEILMKAPKRVRQIQGTLREVNTSGKVTGYCALGYLGCKAGLFKNNTEPYEEIFKTYGLNAIRNRIIDWNDREGLSFHEIGKRLEQMGL